MALAVQILLAVGVLLGVGLAAAGRFDPMARVLPDRPPLLPPGRVTGQGLRGVLLPTAVRGYRMRDVDEVLDRAAGALDEADEALDEALDQVAVTASGRPPVGGGVQEDVAAPSASRGHRAPLTSSQRLLFAALTAQVLVAAAWAAAALDLVPGLIPVVATLVALVALPILWGPDRAEPEGG